MYGYKAGLRADLSRWLNGNRLYLTADYHTAKDSAKIEADQAQDGILEVNTLASVPTSTILGLDYHTPDDKATLHIKARHLKAKKADDTKMVVVVRDRERTLGYREEVKSYKHIDKASNAFVLDVYGSYKFNKNLTLTAGVYNLTDEKYIPWESLRQFAATNINSIIDDKALGLNRYTAPGRNYSVSLTYNF